MHLLLVSANVLLFISSAGSFSVPNSSTLPVPSVPVQIPSDKLPILNTDADTNVPGEDSIDKFEKDMAKIVHELRAGPDTTLPAAYKREKSTRFSYTNIWTAETWEAYNSPWRYWRSLVCVRNSRLLRLIAPQLSVLVLWSIMTLSAGHLLRKALLLKFERLIIPLTPLGLILSFVAALLTLRANNALTRLFTGRAAWGRLLSLTRDTAQVLATYVYPVDPQMGLLCARHLAIIGWLTKTRFREENDEDITSAALSRSDAFFVQSQRKKAPACIMRIRQAVAHLSKKGRLGQTPQLILETSLQEMNHLYGQCEGLLSSPMEPLYTTNTSRLLVFYLMFLPIALQMLNVMAPVGTVLVTTAVGYAMLGMDEITHQIEQPFRVIPMQQLSTRILSDVCDAFVCAPPVLTGSVGKDSPQKEFRKPAYW